MNTKTKSPLKGTTKLSKIKTEKEFSILPEEKDTAKNKIFRLYNADVARLRALVQAANKKCAKNINASEIIRGLIVLGERISPKSIVNAIRSIAK